MTVEGGKGKCSLNTTFGCLDIGDDNLYMFEAFDGTEGNRFNTSNYTGPVIETDEVSLLYITGNNSMVNRSGNYTTPLVILANDSYRNTPIVNATGSFWVTNDGSNYYTPLQNQTNSTGYLIHDFNPTCDYSVGLQYWIGGITDNCYNQTNTTTNFTVTIIGDFLNNITQPLNGILVLRDNNITIQGTVKSDCYIGLDANVTFILVHESNQEFNCTQVENLGGGWYRCILNTSSPAALPARWYNITINSSKDFYNNGTYTGINNFFIETKPEMINLSANSEQGGDTGGWGETWTFNATVTDEDLDNVTLKLWIRKYGEPSWDEVNTTNLTSPINQTIALRTRGPDTGFSCLDIGIPWK